MVDIPRGRSVARFQGRQAIAVAIAALLLLPVGATSLAARPLSRAEVREQVAALDALGRQLFGDPRLSPSGKLACASCHDPAHAFGPPNALPVQLGGRDGREPG